MKKVIILSVLTYLYFVLGVTAQTSKFLTNGIKNNQIEFEIDSLKDNDLVITFEYKKENVEGEVNLQVRLESGIFNKSLIKFETFKTTINNSSIIKIPFTIFKGFNFDDVKGKSIVFKIFLMNSDKEVREMDVLQVTFKKTNKESDNVKTMDDFFRLNLGTNFDYIATNPLKLLYVDASVTTPTAFTINLFNKETKFGFYGRLYQFQGVSLNNIKSNIFITEPNGGVVAGKDTVLGIHKDTLLVKRNYYSRKSDITETKSYGMAIGLSTPIVYNVNRSFYLSVGVHFEGMMTHYERNNTYSKIFIDTLKITKNTFLDSLNHSEPATISSLINYTGTIGISFPIMWHFTTFELKILPAISFPFSTFDDLKGNIPNKVGYSVHAVLTEIKGTGLNIGCEIRGYSRDAPTTFSVFLAKTFNMKKFGDFLKVN